MCSLCAHTLTRLCMHTLIRCCVYMCVYTHTRPVCAKTQKAQDKTYMMYVMVLNDS